MASCHIVVGLKFPRQVTLPVTGTHQGAGGELKIRQKLPPYDRSVCQIAWRVSRGEPKHRYVSQTEHGVRLSRDA